MKFGKFWVLLLIVFFAVSAAPAVSAQEAGESKAQWILLPVMKLSRGIANVAFSPLELPMKWQEVGNEMGGIAGITWGTLKGVCFVVARIGVGVTDIVTFPIPLPNCPEDPSGFGTGYGPIMTPAWVIDIDNDWQNFVYSREAIVVNQN